MSIRTIPKAQFKMSHGEWEWLFGCCACRNEDFFTKSRWLGDFRTQRPEYVALGEYAVELHRHLSTWFLRDKAKEYRVTIPISILLTIHRDRDILLPPNTLLAKIDHLLVNLLPPF